MDLGTERISPVSAAPGPTVSPSVQVRRSLSLREETKKRFGWHPAGEVPETLPLFGEPPDEPVQQPAPKGQSEALSLVLHIYWSAMVELQSLGGAARRAQLPNERRALLALQQVELERKGLAQELLAQVWRIHIGTSNGARAA